jgi:hypothetical protein
VDDGCAADGLAFSRSSKATPFFVPSPISLTANLAAPTKRPHFIMCRITGPERVTGNIRIFCRTKLLLKHRSLG